MKALSIGAGYRTLLGIHALTTGLSAINALVFSRFLGPQDYALFSICGAFVVVIRIIGRWGVGGYLINGVDEATDDDYNVAATYLCLLVLLASPVFACAVMGVVWIADQRQLIPQLLFCCLLPALAIPSSVLSARLEREFHLLTAGVIDISAQATGLLVALWLFHLQFGLWSPVAGMAARATAHSVILLMNKPPLRLLIPKDRFAAIIRFGLKHTLVMSLSQSRQLLLMSLLTRFLGEQIAGHFALATRLYDVVNPTRAIIARIVPTSLADDALRRGFSAFSTAHVARLEVFSSSLLVLVLTPLAAWVIPRLLGGAWTHVGAYLMPIAAAAILVSPYLPLWNVLVARKHFRAAATHMAGLMALEALAVGSLTPLIGARTAFVIPFVGLLSYLLLQQRCLRLGIADRAEPVTTLCAVGTAGACLLLGLTLQ